MKERRGTAAALSAPRDAVRQRGTGATHRWPDQGLVNAMEEGGIDVATGGASHLHTPVRPGSPIFVRPMVLKEA